MPHGGGFPSPEGDPDIELAGTLVFLVLPLVAAVLLLLKGC